MGLKHAVDSDCCTKTLRTVGVCLMGVIPLPSLILGIKIRI